MDGPMFDALSRRLGATGTRRVVVGGLAALLGGTLSGFAMPAPVEAKKCRRKGKNCSLAKDGECLAFCKENYPKSQLKQCTAGCPTRCTLECCSGVYKVKNKKSGLGACSCAADDHACTLDANCCSGFCGDDGFCKPVNATCAAAPPHTCGSFAICGRDPLGACSCTKSIDGAAACGSDACYDSPNPCNSTAQCVALYGAGFVCQAADSGCCGQRCVVPCGVTVPAATVRAAGAHGLIRNRGGR